MKLVPYKEIVLFFGMSSLVYANPENPTVISGDVSFDTPSANVLEVTSTDFRSIVDWETFSNDSNETVDFVLPSSTSAILNRVTSSSASDISGSITSIERNVIECSNN